MLVVFATAWKMLALAHAEVKVELFAISSCVQFPAAHPETDLTVVLTFSVLSSQIAMYIRSPLVTSRLRPKDVASTGALLVQCATTESVTHAATEVGPGVGVRVGVGVGVWLGVGVAVGVAVGGPAVGEAVGVGETVGVGEGVGETVGVGEMVGVGEAVGVAVGVGVIAAAGNAAWSGVTTGAPSPSNSARVLVFAFASQRLPDSSSAIETGLLNPAPAGLKLEPVVA